MYVRKETKVLSAADCRELKQACVHARKIGRPLNTLVTFVPYPGSLPPPEARSIDLNRLRSYLDTWTRRHVGGPLTAIWVWHSDVTGRNPHVHVFMHCPKPHRDELRQSLVPLYPPRVIDVREGSDYRRLHQSGQGFGSTLDYLCRFKSQQAYWADRGRTPRASIRDENGRHRGIPLTDHRQALGLHPQPLPTRHQRVSASGTASAQGGGLTLVTGPNREMGPIRDPRG